MGGRGVLDRISGRTVPAVAALGAAVGRYVADGEFSDGGPAWRTQVLPDTVTIEAVLAIGGQVDALVARRSPIGDLIDVSPLVNGGDARRILAHEPFEADIDEHLPYLRAVCFRPATRLRPVNLLMPVPRIRRITPQTVTRLAAHSEDWAAVRPDGVRPDRVLSPERDVDLDLYENRIAARLVDEIWRYLTVRASQIRAISDMFGDIERYAEDIADRPWQSGLRLWYLVAELAGQADWRAQAALRLEELERLYAAVARLRASPVWAGVNRRAMLGTALRTTNLFSDEERYRHVSSLWLRCVATMAQLEAIQHVPSRIQQWCHAFASYVLVLVLRALDELGAVQVGHAGDQVSYRWHEAAIAVRAEEGSVLVLVLNDTTVLRIVALPHGLTASGVDDIALTGFAALAEGPLGTATVVVYPGTRHEREELGLAARLRAYDTPSSPAYRRAGPPLWTVPVSPLEIDSVTRLARVLRWAIEEPRLAGYPRKIRCGPSLGAAFVAGTRWLSWRSPEVVVTRVPAALEVETAHAQLQAQRYETSRHQRRGTNVAEVERLWVEVVDAIEHTRRLTRCPRCGVAATQPERTLQRRDDDTFRCTCADCGAVWESRRCRSCQRGYPVLDLDLGERPGLLDGDQLDRRIGSDILAAPCATRERTFVCPWCATCGNVQSEVKCARCELNRPVAHARGETPT